MNQFGYAFATLCCLLPSWNLAVADENRPNFVVIMADDMGYGDASCYGDPGYETPHLDALAQGGLRFTDFHSSGPVCSPTRAGLLTGRYQQRAGIPGVINADPNVNRHHGLFPKEVTFAEVLKEAGYQTAIFGKWHLGYGKRYNPMHHGFDEFRGYVSGNIDFISHVDRMGIFDWWNGTQLKDEEGYVTHLITQHGVRFIEENRDRPFCLYLAHEAVHSPYQGPNDPPVRAVGKPNLKGNARKDVKAAYREMMIEMDNGVGEVVKTLKRLGLERNTLVIFISDNGANQRGSNGLLRGFKGSLWEGGHRVPAIAYWPGRIEPGQVTDQTAISIDLFPTMLDLAGAKLPDGHKLDGQSWTPLFDGEPLPSRMLFWQFGNKSAVRQGDWKLILGESQLKRSPGLFHLGEDLSEQVNLAKEHPQRVEELQNALAKWKADVTTGATAQPEAAD